MDQSRRKLGHDLRGVYQALTFSIEVLRGALPPNDRDIFLNHVIESCEKIDMLLGQCDQPDRGPFE